MSKVIVYQDNQLDRAVILVPAYNDSARPVGDTDDALIMRVLSKSLPIDAEYSIVESSTIPSNRSNRDSWFYDHSTGTIQIA